MKSHSDLKLSDFENEINSVILKPTPLPDGINEIDISVDDLQYYSPKKRVEVEISQKLVPKYRNNLRKDPKDWLNTRENIFKDKNILQYSTIKGEIDNCCLQSVGKNKYPFEFFNKQALKEVNYVNAKKPRIEENPEKKQDLVITVVIYSNEKKGEKSHSFFVLGSQTLDTLASSIYCFSNFSNDMDANAKNCSYFFIENTFYNKGMVSDEDRHILAREDRQLISELEQLKNQEGSQISIEKIKALTDQKNRRRAELLQILLQYQEPITWLREQNPNIKYDARPMETTHFRDLTLKLGTPYLFSHNGCEHVIMFEHVRSYHARFDNFESFPVLFYQNKERRLKCFSCKYLPGRVVVANDQLTQDNPSLLCDLCFSELHPEDTDPDAIKDYEKQPYYLMNT